MAPVASVLFFQLRHANHVVNVEVLSHQCRERLIMTRKTVEGSLYNGFGWSCCEAWCESSLITQSNTMQSTLLPNIAEA